MTKTEERQTLAALIEHADKLTDLDRGILLGKAEMLVALYGGNNGNDH